MKRLLALSLALFCIACAFPAAWAEDAIIMSSELDEAVAAPGETPDPAVPAPQETPVFVTLQYGAKGEQVLVLQTRLTTLGYYSGQISGDFLDGTDAAVRAFQKSNWLAANGKVTPTTWNALMSADAIGKDGQTHALTQADTAPQPGTPQATPAPPDDGSFVFERTLKYEMRGADVRALQQRLTDLGYYSKEVSGNYLGNTRNAVRAFQKHNALPVDGVAGEATQRVLWDDAQALPASAPPRPTPTPPPLRYMLKVDVTNQVTTAYELDAQGEYSIVARQMICSTGTRSNPTPLKTTQSKGSRARWGYFPEWDSHAQYLTRIDSANAFHSVLYREPNAQALVVGAYNALGSRASHGCVRLLVADAKWIYDNCPSGTTITVYEGASDPELTQMLKPPPLNRSTMLPQATPDPTAPPAWSPAASPPPIRTLKKGITGEDVWWLQTTLTALGYYQGTVSGGYYEGTIAAVKAFQKDAGLTADGVAGRLTLTALYEDPRYALAADGRPAEQDAFPGQVGSDAQLVVPAPTPGPTHVRMTPIPVPTSAPDEEAQG